jgi:hypothetical protein
VLLEKPKGLCRWIDIISIRAGEELDHGTCSNIFTLHETNLDFPPALANMDQNLPPVYQYIWRDYSLPGYKGVMMTLSNVWSIVLFAFFASLLAYTQIRFWIILKYLGLRKLRPVRLSVESEEQLSQVDALRAWFGQPSPAARNRQNSQSISTSPKDLGILAIINVAGFFICGILAPLYLTGNLSTTVVLSKSIDSCIGYEDRKQSSRYTAQLADSFFKKCLLNTSDVFTSCSKESGIVGSTPQLHISREETCPFPGDVCQDGVQPVRLEYVGLSSRDYGVNLGSQVLVDHRVVCAPLKIDRFLLVDRAYNDTHFPGKTGIWFGRKYHDPTFNGTGSGIYGTLLATLNGPNQYSGEYSGNYVASYSRPQPAYDLNVYPIGLHGSASETIHPSLRRDDGDVFIVMFRAGRSLYETTTPIDDPFYAAHNKFDPSGTIYIPDYEATALGCVEQYKLCWNAKISSCTNWGISVDVSVKLMLSAYPNLTTDRELLLDLGFVYPFFTTMASVDKYLHQRAGTQMLISSLFRDFDVVLDLHDHKEQWILEVQAWFITAFVNARYSLLQTVRRDGPKRTGNETKPMLKLCHSVLFQNNDYTNINFISLLACTSVLLLICAVSWGDTITKAWRRAWKALISGARNLRDRVGVIYQACNFHEFLPSLVAYLTFRRQRQPRFPWNPFWNGNRRWQDQRLFSGNDWIRLGVVPPPSH